MARTTTTQKATTKKTRKSSGPRKAGPIRVKAMAEKALKLANKMITATNNWTGQTGEVDNAIVSAANQAQTVKTSLANLLQLCTDLTTLGYPSRRAAKLAPGDKVTLTLPEAEAEALDVVSGSLWKILLVNRGLATIIDADDDRRIQVRTKALTRAA